MARGAPAVPRIYLQHVGVVIESLVFLLLRRMRLRRNQQGGNCVCSLTCQDWESPHRIFEVGALLSSVAGRRAGPAGGRMPSAQPAALTQHRNSSPIAGQAGGSASSAKLRSCVYP